MYRQINFNASDQWLPKRAPRIARDSLTVPRGSVDTYLSVLLSSLLNFFKLKE